MPIETYRPFVWMQSISGSVNYLRFIVHLPDRVSIPVHPDSVTPDDATGTLTLEYTAFTNPDAPDVPYAEVSYTLDDPFFENVVVIINNTGGRKEAQGTGHQSEGDTSGGGD